MNRLFVMAGLSAAIATGLPGAGTAQTATCPEVESARQAYLTKLSALKLNDADIRTPRTLASARREESPRSVQQAPRGDQSAQQAPRTARQRAARAHLETAKGLIADADASCRAGNTAVAAKKANAALRLLK